MQPDLSGWLRSGMTIGVAAWALVGAAVSSGCRSSPAAAGPPDALTVCPATPDDTIGQSCAVEGMRCAPEYPCGETQAVLVCTCAGGAFQCRDGRGNRLDAGDTPSCPAHGGAVVCPATEATASGATCSVPGAQCAYPAQCDGGIPEYDTCYCFTGQTPGGTMGLRWECSNTCGGAGTQGDGGADPGTPLADGALPPADGGGGDAHGLDSATE